MWSLTETETPIFVLLFVIWFPRATFIDSIKIFRKKVNINSIQKQLHNKQLTKWNSSLRDMEKDSRFYSCLFCWKIIISGLCLCPNKWVIFYGFASILLFMVAGNKRTCYTLFIRPSFIVLLNFPVPFVLYGATLESVRPFILP